MAAVYVFPLRRFVAILTASTLVGTLLVATQLDAGPAAGAPATSGFVNDPIVMPTSLVLTTDRAEITAGSSAVITATTDVSVTGTGGTVQIVDQTTSATVKSCTTGTECTVSQSFNTGGAHTYVATFNGLTSNQVMVARAAWTVALTADKSQFLAGENVTFTATANQNVGSTGANYRIYIFDKSTGTRLASCSSGTTCSYTLTYNAGNYFYTGAARNYVAVVAKSGTPTLSSVLDVQATSPDYPLARAPWLVTLVSNKATFAVGESVTLTATTDQNVASTNSQYATFIFDKTTGARVALCVSGVTCSVTLAAPFTSGVPHTYVAMVARRASSTYSTVTDVQSTSNEVAVARQMWTVTLATDVTEFAAGQTVSFSAVANQVPGSNFFIYIFDQTTGAQVSYCSNTAVCNFTKQYLFTTGGPHSYVAVVAPGGTTYATIANAEATSNAVQVSRKPWTVILSADKSTFKTDESVTFTLTTNQNVAGTQNDYRARVWDETAGEWAGAICSVTSCAISMKKWCTGGPHTYIAVVGELSSAPYPQMTDVQAFSEPVTITRAPWTLIMGKTITKVTETLYDVTFILHANQPVGLATNSQYGFKMKNVITGVISTCTTYNDSRDCYFKVRQSTAEPIKSYVGYVTNSYGPSFTDTPVMSNGLTTDLNLGPILPDEVIAGANPAEEACVCPEGDPISTATGEFYLPVTDLSLPGVGPEISVDRTYSTALASYSGSFGFGWAAAIDTRITVLIPGTVAHPLPYQVEVVQENGSRTVFTASENGLYLAASRVMATLNFDAASQTWVYVRRSSDILTFDYAGKLLSIADPSGVVTQFQRSLAGQVTAITAAGGRSIALTWTGNRVSSLLDSAGRTVSFAYNAAGELTSVTGADGKTQAYTYDSAHRMTVLTNPGPAVTTNVYIGGRVVAQTDPIGRVLQFSYIISGNTTTTTITAPDGSKKVDVYVHGRLTSRTLAATTALAATTTFVYDDAGNILSTTDPLGRVTTSTYDIDGNRLSTTDPLGRKITWTYDSDRRRTSSKDPLGNITTLNYTIAGDLANITSSNGRVQSWTYNADGTPATGVSPSGGTTLYAYDPAGRLTSTTDPDGRTSSVVYNAAGIPTQLIAADGAITSMTSDVLGRPLSTTDPLGRIVQYGYNTAGDVTSVTDPAGHVTLTAYDAAGQMLSTTDAAGEVTQFGYTLAGQLATVTDANQGTSTRSYNARGQLISTTDPIGRVTTYAYDGAGRPLSTTLPSGSISSVTYDAAGQVVTATNALGHVTSFTYTLTGQPATMTDPLGRVTATAYTADGLPGTITLPGGSTVTYGYNADGQSTSFTNADGGVTTYGYSTGGMLLGKTEPGGLSTGYAYDAAGRLSTVTFPDLSAATYSYNVGGQVTGVDYSGTSADTAYTYDLLGRPLTMLDATGTSTYAYDVLGRLTSETNGAGATVGYGYDDVSQLTSVTYPGNRSVDYDYDAAGQMTSLTDWSDNVTSFAWSVNGQLQGQTGPNGVTQTNTFDAAGQLASISTAHGASVLASFGYGYDSAGQLIATDTVLNGAALDHDYGYDSLGQLASVSETPGVGAPSSVTVAASPAGLLTSTVGSATLSYNSAQQVTILTPVVGAETTFAFDARGSRTSSTVAATQYEPSKTTSFSYTASGALASVVTPTATVNYTSDARNLRQSRTVGTETQPFTWSNVGGLPVLLDDGEHSYLYGPSSSPLAQVDDATGEVEYLHADLLGTPRLLTDDSGDAVGTVSFDAFGNRATYTGEQSAFGFTGNLTDADTGLLYLRARDYDPKTGQFLTVDPLVDRTRQPYAYTGNNPALLTDPTGLEALSEEEKQAKADAEVYGGAHVMKNMLLNFVTAGTYGVQQSLCAGNDLWTSLNMAYNPVYSILEGSTNLVQDIQNGESSLMVLMDVLQVVGGVASLAGLGGGVGLVGSLGRSGSHGGSLSPSALAGEGTGGSSNFVYRALNAQDRASVNAGLGISAKNPGGSWSLGEHVAQGSSRASITKDPWIATSRDPEVAAAFDSGYGVVRIDLDLVSSVTAEAWRIYPRVDGKAGLPFHYSFWQQEVSIFQHIPAGAIR